jgi:hypothetical protein
MVDENGVSCRLVPNVQMCFCDGVSVNPILMHAFMKDDEGS